jgi:uncharacterized protein (TIGR00645 family)
MDVIIERLLLGMRWLLLPLYVALLAAVLAIYVMIGRELFHLMRDLWDMTDVELVLVLLSVLDLVLVANLLVMVSISSYESFVTRIEVAEGESRPEWLGKLDSGNVKVKVMLSVTMISAIHLLRFFMADVPSGNMPILAGIHLVFVISTLAFAWIDRVSRHDH